MKHMPISPRAAQSGRQDDLPARRWVLLDLVREARGALGLRDRDVAILRGLLSLLPEGAEGVGLTVFASNRVLAARCDGVEERTLRRHLVRLEAKGLIARRLSPSGKRYRLQAGGEVLAYGMDLAPLFAQEEALRALGAAEAATALKARLLRARLRDWLYRQGEGAGQELARMLRRKLSLAALEALWAGVTGKMSGSDGQIVRDIQNSDEESFEEKQRAGEEGQDTAAPPSCAVTLSECLDLAATARTLSPTLPRSWPDLLSLARQLAPAIGIAPPALTRAETALGPHGATLAILGLVQAFDRVKKPEAYLSALTAKAPRLDLGRMFRSLTGAACIPG